MCLMIMVVDGAFYVTRYVLLQIHHESSTISGESLLTTLVIVAYIVGGGCREIQVRKPQNVDLLQSGQKQKEANEIRLTMK